MSTHLKTSYAKEAKWEAICTGGNPAISSDGQYLLAPCNSSVNVIDMNTGAIFHTFEPDSEPALAAAISADHEFVATASRSLVVKVWSFRTFECLKSFKAHEAPAVGMDFDKISHTLLATGGANGEVKVWDVQQGYCTHVFRGSVGVIGLVRFHPTKYRLFTSSDDCRLRYWNLEDKKKHKALDAHASVVRDIAFSDDNMRFYTSSRDQLLHEWDADALTIANTVPLYEAVEGLVCVNVPRSHFKDTGNDDADDKSDDGTMRVFLTAGDHGVRFFTPDGEEVQPKTRKLWMGKACKRLVYSASAQRVVVLTHELHIGVIDIADVTATREMIGHYDEITDLRYLHPSPDRELLVVSTNSHDVFVVNPDNRSSSTLAGHSDIVLAVDIAADQSAIATVSKDAGCIVWRVDGDDITPAFMCTGHTATVSSVAFCKKTNASLFTGSEDTTIKRWSLPWDDAPHTATSDISSATRASVSYSRIAHRKDINALDVAPNDRLLASASQDRTIKLWDARTGEERVTLRGHKRGVWGVRFSPSDQIVASASGDATIRLWNAANGACLRTLEGHTNSVLKLVFVSGGQQILSSSSDGVVKIWNVRSGECTGTLDAHDDKVWALDVNASDTAMVTGAADGALVVWRDDTKEKEDSARKEEEERLREEQELNNLIQSEEYAEAFRRAVNKNRPRTLLTLLRHLRTNGEMDEVEPCIQALNIEQITRLLSFIENWNFNSKTSREAHELLNIVLTTTSFKHLMTIPSITKMVNSLIAYSERHMRRVRDLTQRTAFVEYTHDGMRKGVGDQTKKRRHEEA